MSKEVMNVEDAFFTDLIERKRLTEEQAQYYWERYKDRLFSNLWDEYSSTMDFLDFKTDSLFKQEV